MMSCVSRGVKLTAAVKASTPAPGKMKDFVKHLKEQAQGGDLKALGDEVVEFASGFPMPGN